MDESQTELQDGGIYLIDTPNGAILRRVAFRSDGMITISSDNRSYEDHVTEKKPAGVTGIAVWFCRDLI